ncbi:MAG: hypothetical protein P8P84_18685, partial [Paracoccaceae bacterium]|nr:hypothetical protein [Paracoccaceae bacterium]
FLKRETAEGLETACEIVWCHETCDTHAEKIVIVIRIVFPNRDFDHTLHPIDLSILPMVIRPEQTLPHSVRFPNQRKTLWPRLDLASFPRLFGALETVLYKNHLD